MRTDAGLVIRRTGKDSAGRWQLIYDHPGRVPRPWPAGAEILGQVQWGPEFSRDGSLATWCVDSVSPPRLSGMETHGSRHPGGFFTPWWMCPDLGNGRRRAAGLPDPPAG